MQRTPRLLQLFDSIEAKPRLVRSNYAGETFSTDPDGHIVFSYGDLEDPKNWSLWRKCYITSIGLLLAFNSPFASSAPAATIQSLMKDLEIPRETASLVTTLFLCGYVAGPLLWAPLSEHYGRKWVFRGTWIGYFVFSFLCAFTPNLTGLLIGRFLTGIFASAAMSNVPGIFADLWGPLARGKAMALFCMMANAGPALGPVTTGFMSLTVGWRWAFYELIWMAFVTMLFLFTYPETQAVTILAAKARRAQKTHGYSYVKPPAAIMGKSLLALFRVAFIRPWKIMFDPIALCSNIYITLIYGLLYMLFEVYPLVFQEVRGWNAGVGELPLLGTFLGSVLGALLIIAELSTIGKKKLQSPKGYQPEDRLTTAMLGCIMFPICLFWFSWTGAYPSVHWIVPTVAGVFLSMSIMLIFLAFLNYLTDSYLMFAASAMAGNTFWRSLFAAGCPLFTVQMYQGMGIGGAGSLLGGIACLLAPIPFIFYRYGERVRTRSKFAPTPISVTAKV